MTVVELKKEEQEPDSPFVIGDVVQLNSGGVLTTVRRLNKLKGGVTMVTVDWMDINESLNTAEFDARQLQAQKVYDE